MKLISLLLLACMTLSLQAESPEAHNQRMQWWRTARFGLFIHYGLYATPAGQWNNQKTRGGGEWILNNAHIPLPDYEKLTAQFNPTNFDAKKIVALAKAAGMRYIVITAKHHDGFCLWPSKVSNYTIAQTPAKDRDLLKELADACTADGTVRFCLYYSIMDWHHPDAQAKNAPNYNPPRNDPTYQPNPNFPRYLEQYMKPQLKELVETYHPGVLWFDGEWIPDYTDAQSRDVDAYCRSLDPNLIINNRVGKSRKGMAGLSADDKSPGDFGTPEQEIPATGLPVGVDWESCMTMNNTWGYKSDDKAWKPTRDLLRNLVDVVSKGGNYLLNVGPMADGSIPPESVTRLQQIADWMKSNPDTIHAAKPSPFKKWPWGRATLSADDKSLYLHVLVWPNGDDLIVPLFSRATPLGNFQTDAKHDGLHLLNLPEKSPDPYLPVLALKLQEPPVSPDPTPLKQKEDGTLTLSATDAEVHGQNARLEKKGKNPPNIGYWTNPKDHLTWTAQIDKPATFTVHLEYSLAPNSAGSTIELQFTPTQKLQIPLEPGKDFLDFKTTEVGKITLPQGPLTITLQPTKKPGLAVMDLRTITLKPTP